MAPAGVKKDQDKGMADVATDLWQLCKDYAKQELVDPLASLKTFLKFGIGGAVLLALGVLFLALGVLRGFQHEIDVFSGGGNWTWAPYVITLAVTAIAAGLAAWGIKRPLKAQEKDVR